MTSIPIQAKTTLTSATASSGLDISESTYGFYPDQQVPGWFTGVRLGIKIYGLDAGAIATITIESSTDSFSEVEQHASFNIAGPQGATAATGELGSGEGESTGFPANPYHLFFGPNDQAMALIPWGEAGAELRTNIKSLTGGGHLTYESWLQF